MENPVNGSELGLLMPTAEDSQWFIIFEFSESGYIKDDDRDDLDADAMIKSIREGTKQSNEERRRRGWSTMEIVGWEVPPKYNTETKNLEWAIRGENEGDPVVNFNTRILGRRGVMEANLVIDPSVLQDALPEFRTLLAGFDFVDGQRYSDFRQGDKIAKYGLAALVTGGAAAVALKSGLLQKLLKPIIIGLLAIGAIFKKFFRGGRTSTSE